MQSHHSASLADLLAGRLAVNSNFDLIERRTVIGGKNAVFFLIDGFIKDDLFEKILEFFYSIPADSPAMQSTAAFLRHAAPYCEVVLESDPETLIQTVLSGQTVLVFEHDPQALILDLRTYPQRGTAEPDKDKTFRGSRDGFVETLVLNCALIRRRIRSTTLRMEQHTVCPDCPTDVVICYMDDKADPKLLRRLRQKLDDPKLFPLTMNQESLAEQLLPRRRFDPLPHFKYTERPDAAAAQIMEGNIAVIVDNSPSVMLLPVSLFDLIEEANDYVLPPLTGTYLRLTRFIMLLLPLLLTPVWLLLVQNPAFIPDCLQFILPTDPPAVPFFQQLILLEIGIDALKLAALNSPGTLSATLSIVSGIIVSDFAVQSGWFSADPMLYTALLTIAGYNQLSQELGYAVKLFRIMLLILVRILNGFGFAVGLISVLILLRTCPTFGGRSYLYPLSPFRKNALLRRLCRPPLHNAKTSK